MTVTKRQELLFIYETKDCNPNGDPLDENKPRTDPETGVATVTDVRIKRTIRDYLHKVKEHEILVRDTVNSEGYLKDGKGRCEDFFGAAGISEKETITSLVSKVEKVILEKCIDVRLFGCTLPVEHGTGTKAKKSSIRLTGPVQFNGFNRSLHRIAPILVQGTAGFASTKQATQKSFREDHIVPYACIAAYGVVNEIAARSTGLTDDDVTLLLEGLWNGTESLISRSKMGHQPLMLMRITYNDGYRVGDLAGRIKLISEKEDIQIRSLNDYSIDVTVLVDSIVAAKGKIESIEVKQDDRLKFRDTGEECLFAKIQRLNEITINPLPNIG
ncbi:MAG: type I-B CRISPR-associated protein Cas7/Csh2 [Planctomycetes bacterium RBG_16_43_13]|nr:MAG: type I-B CRISPR-associated protein Cas7/Csh2 [Planctomycetes bacterium RBG_16_43_13]